MHCWVCDNAVERFAPYGIPARPGRCPHCGAKPRTRALVRFLADVARPRLAPGSEVLEVGPSRVNTRFLAREAVLGAARYTAIDVRRLGFHATLAPPHRAREMDVTRMTFADEAFDVILCNNTLPYVRDPGAALAQIRRCLKHDGLAVLDTHREAGPSRSVSDYRREHPDLDDAYFAENGDEWVFGTDLLERIRAAGLDPRVTHPFADRPAEFLRENGLKANPETLIAFRAPAGAMRFGLEGGPA